MNLFDLVVMREILMWCTIFNASLLTLWTFMFMFYNEWNYRMLQKVAPISKETFYVLHYGFVGFFKLNIFLFNIVPWIALLIIDNSV